MVIPGQVLVPRKSIKANPIPTGGHTGDVIGSLKAKSRQKYALKK
jgi:hypothetical protein